MSFETNVRDVVQRMANTDKQLRTLINGNLADLSALATADKSSLLAAINELQASLAVAAGIDDNSTGTGSTWSSQKTRDEITAASVTDRARANHTGTQSADTITDGATNKVFTGTDRTKLAGIAPGATANATDAELRDRATHTGTQLSSTISDFDAKLAALKDDILGGAGAAYDTLGELQQLLEDNADLIASLEAAAANRVRFDAAQSLTAPQQAQARANIGAVASADVGPTDTNFVQIYEAALL